MADRAAACYGALEQRRFSKMTWKLKCEEHYGKRHRRSMLALYPENTHQNLHTCDGDDYWFIDNWPGSNLGTSSRGGCGWRVGPKDCEASKANWEQFKENIRKDFAAETYKERFLQVLNLWKGIGYWWILHHLILDLAHHSINSGILVCNHLLNGNDTNSMRSAVSTNVTYCNPIFRSVFCRG